MIPPVKLLEPIGEGVYLLPGKSFAFFIVLSEQGRSPLYSVEGLIGTRDTKEV